MEDAISRLFVKRQENYEMEKGYEICVKARRKRESEELYKFINTRVHPKARKKLIRMIESYADSIQQILDSNNETVYRAGFKDCMQLILDAVSF